MIKPTGSICKYIYYAFIHYVSTSLKLTKSMITLNFYKAGPTTFNSILIFSTECYSNQSHNQYFTKPPQLKYN